MASGSKQNSGTSDFVGPSATNLVAGSVALGAFIVSVIAGLAAGGSPVGILTRAMTAMFVCYFVGLGVALIGSFAVREHVDRYKAERPIPEVPDVPAEIQQGWEEYGSAA
jgi:amino acid transporter